MPETTVDGVRLAYDVIGDGPPVLLVCGTGQPAVSWHLGTAQALASAGYTVVTFDNRGVPPSDAPPPPYTVADMVGDAAGLLEALDLGPARVAGLSLGALITQELALARPDLVRAAVMMGTVGRANAMLRAWANGQLALARLGVDLPPEYEAAVLAMQVVGAPRQLDDAFVGPFVELAQGVEAWRGPGPEGQYAADAAYDDRLGALAGVRVPSLVIAFEHDLLTPPALGREVAGAIPGARYVEVAGCGHLGPMEDPDAVLPLLVDFFAEV